MAKREPETPTLVERTLSLTSKSEEATPLEELSLVPKWSRPLPPLGLNPLMGRWVWPISSWGGWLAYDPAPRIPTGSCLTQSLEMDSFPLHSHGGGSIPISDLGHCMNDPTADPVQILRSIWILSTDWGNLSKYDALSLTHEQLYHSQTLGKWLEMCSSCLWLVQIYTVKFSLWLLNDPMLFNTHMFAFSCIGIILSSPCCHLSLVDWILLHQILLGSRQVFYMIILPCCVPIDSPYYTSHHYLVVLLILFLSHNQVSTCPSNWSRTLNNVEP